MSLAERVLATVRKRSLLPRGTRVVAAVSGGADSVALALIVRALEPELGITLAGLVHLNHQLRGADSDADAAFVAALAGELGVPVVAEAADVRARAETERESLEAAARRARYELFERAAGQLRADVIATGHTANDQAETLLMRLARGAGLNGLSGVRPRNGRVVRPLLDVTRAEIEAYLRERRQTWREDTSNGDLSVARNRVRHLVMPRLIDAAGPGAVAAMARTAALVQDDAEELDRQAIEIARRAVLTTDRLEPVPTDRPDVIIDIERLAAAGPALARRVIRAVMSEATGREPSLEHVESVRSLINRAPFHGVARPPGLVVRRTAGHLRFSTAGAFTPLPELTLRVPGVVELPGGGSMSAELGSLDAGELERLRARGETVAVQQPDAAVLTIRSRRPGDALRPLGAPGRRKLQDVFVDRKIAREERDRVPLVVDEMGRIIWVVGHTIADEFRVTAPGSRVLVLKVRQLGGRF